MFTLASFLLSLKLIGFSHLALAEPDMAKAAETAAYGAKLTGDQATKSAEWKQERADEYKREAEAAKKSNDTAGAEEAEKKRKEAQEAADRSRATAKQAYEEAARLQSRANDLRKVQERLPDNLLKAKNPSDLNPIKTSDAPSQNGATSPSESPVAKSSFEKATEAINSGIKQGSDMINDAMNKAGDLAGQGKEMLQSSFDKLKDATFGEEPISGRNVDRQIAIDQAKTEAANASTQRLQNEAASTANSALNDLQKGNLSNGEVSSRLRSIGEGYGDSAAGPNGSVDPKNAAYADAYHRAADQAANAPATNTYNEAINRGQSAPAGRYQQVGSERTNTFQADGKGNHTFVNDGKSWDYVRQTGNGVLYGDNRGNFVEVSNGTGRLNYSSNGNGGGGSPLGSQIVNTRDISPSGRTANTATSYRSPSSTNNGEIVHLGSACANGRCNLQGGIPNTYQRRPSR